MQNTFQWTRRASSGMSLIEVMLYLAIVAFLLVMAIRLGTNLMSGAKKSATDTSLRLLSLQIDKYMMDTGMPPQLLEDLLRRPSSGGASLRWQGPYVTDPDLLKDGWGHDFVYTPTGDKKRPYRLQSYGSGGEGTSEDKYIEAPYQN